MVRWLYDGGEQVVDNEGNARGELGFTVWTQASGGEDVTADFVAPDGITAADVKTLPSGEVPYLRGPDGNMGPLYRDTGTGTRSPWYSSEAIAATAATVEDLAALPPGLPAGGSAGDILYRAGEQLGVWAPPPTSTGGSGGSGDWDSITNKPATFPPSGHTHTSGQVSDSTPTGRSVLTAPDAQAARAAIGAGTGNGTSNLQLGAGGAAAFNHTHQASAIDFAPGSGLTATNVQDAIAQAATMGGSSTATPILAWVYNGGWPTMPATKPAGVVLVQVCGPTPGPPSYPAWMGNGTGQVPTKVSLWP